VRSADRPIEVDKIPSRKNMAEVRASARAIWEPSGPREGELMGKSSLLLEFIELGESKGGGRNTAGKRAFFHK